MTFRRVIALTVAVLISTSVTSQAQQQPLTHQPIQSLNAKAKVNSTYNPSFGRLSLQFGSGLLFGSIGGGAGGLLGIAIFAPRSGAGFATLGIGVLGAVTGYTIGSALGVYVVANSPSYDASFGHILLGNTIGAAAGIGAMVLTADAFGKGAPVAASLGVALSTTVIGGMIANKLSIARRNIKSNALLNISDEKAVLSAPSLQLTKVGNYELSNSGMKDYSITVKLLNISL